MKSTDDQQECSVCACEFSLTDEGGIEGLFGIIPVAFCPTCLSCMEDMCDQLRNDEIWNEPYQLRSTTRVATS